MTTKTNSPTPLALPLEYGPVTLPAGVPEDWGGVSDERGCVGYIMPELAQYYASQSARIAELEGALCDARLALIELSRHPAFEGEAPEFNEGGVGYEASRTLRALLAGGGK